MGGQVSEEVMHNVSLVAKTNTKKKKLSLIRCYHCGNMGHHSLKCSKKKNVKENTERDIIAFAAVEYYAMKFEQYFLMS